MGILLLIAQGGWKFLTGPVGRWIALALAVLALLAGVHHHGVNQGRDGEKASQAARMERARKDVARREAKAVQITDQSRANLDREKVRIQTRTVTLIKEVVRYVPPAADARCIVPVGFVRYHDAAAGQTELPPTASGPLDAPSGVDLSSVASTVAENYGTAFQWRAEALTWRAWYREQKAAWDGPTPALEVAPTKPPVFYGGGPARPARRSEQSAQVLAKAKEYIGFSNGSPISTADLLNYISACGLEVRGQNPRNALSALLSNSGEFKANGRSGWTLADPSEPKNAEAVDAAIPRQDASTASFEPRLISEETPQRGYGEPQQRPGGGT